MSKELFSDAMSELDDKYIVEAATFQARRNYKVYKFLVRAACMFLVVLAGAGIFLTFHAESRAEVIGWLRSRYESFVTYNFVGDKNNQELLLYYPGWIPEECEFVTSFETGDYGEIYIYSDPNDLIVQFSYQSELGTSNLNLVGENLEPKDVMINGNKGDLYISNDPKITSALIWQDRDRKALFYVSGPYDEEILIKMAENVKVKE